MTTEMTVKGEVSYLPATATQAVDMAKWLAGSSLIPDALKGKPHDVFVILMTGHELGVSPMQALRGIHVIKGKPVLSADMMVAQCVRSPECEYFRLMESTDEQATYETKRKGSEPVTLVYTIMEAQAAKLTGNDVWQKHRPAMLRARCSSGLARAVYPDLVMGIYTPDEASEFAPSVTVEMPKSIPVVEEPKVIEPKKGPILQDSEPPKKKRGRPKKKAETSKELDKALEHLVPDDGPPEGMFPPDDDDIPPVEQATDKDANPWIGRINKVDERHSKPDAKREWTLFIFHCEDGGEFISFSDTDAMQARATMGDLIKIAWSDTGRDSRKIENIGPAE